MTSPTFVARFADGVTTRMTCNCEDHHLDLPRGIKLSQAAYESRIKKSPPAIVEARIVEPFIDDAIKIYSRAELEASQPSTAMDLRPVVPELNPQRARRAVSASSAASGPHASASRID
jgi:hypothetical protein